MNVALLTVVSKRSMLCKVCKISLAFEAAFKAFRVLICKASSNFEREGYVIACGIREDKGIIVERGI